jgi:hypothetical protein
MNKTYVTCDGESVFSLEMCYQYIYKQVIHAKITLKAN